MRRIVRAAAFALGIAALSPPLSRAADAPGATPGGTELDLTQVATRTMAPDRIRAILRIDVKGGNARQVQADLNQRMAQALDRAKPVAAVKSETGAYAVNRDFTSKDRDVWHASQTLILSSADFAAVLSLVGDLQGAGLLMSGLEFFLAPETLKAAESDLTATALAALRARAEAVAKDLGMTLDHFKTISVSNASAPIRARAELFASPSAASSSPAPPVAQAGDATVTLSVTAVIVLVPSKS
jgi:predicted secreted protein